MRVVEPSTTPGRVRIYRDDQAPTTQPLQGLKGPRKWARVHAAEKIVPEVDAVSHHCHAKRREMSESLLRRPGVAMRLVNSVIEVGGVMRIRGSFKRMLHEVHRVIQII